MPYGRPLDTSPGDWYKAAKTIDQNREANEAFQLASCPAPHPVPHSILISLVKTNPTPVNMDVRLKKNPPPPPPTCYRCHKTGHKAPDCPDKYDIRMSSVEELEMEMMVRRDIMKIEKTPESEKHFILDNEWKACPRCPLVIVSKYCQIYAIPKPYYQTCKNLKNRFLSPLLLRKYESQNGRKHCLSGDEQVSLVQL